jgi:hypothetical protein
LDKNRIKTWTDYRAEVREFDAVVEHARAVSSALIGKTARSRQDGYGEQIFVKLLAHCVALRRLSPDPNRAVPHEFWDVPSSSAIARCVIEAHDAFDYIVAPSASELEREFRLLLWEAHDKTRRIRMAEAIGSTDPKKSKLQADAKDLTSRLKGHSLFSTIRKDVRQKILKGDPPAFHLSQREMCRESGVDYDYYNAITVQLSQYVHTHPYSVHQLFVFRAGSLEGLRMMALPLQFALPFLARVTEGIRDRFPGLTPEPPSRTAQSMALWRMLAQQGVKTAN